MLKKYRKTLIIATIIILLPMLAGLILWNRLPEQFPIHFNAAGEVDGFSSKAFGVFGLPLILVAFQWLCAVGSLKMLGTALKVFALSNPFTAILMALATIIVYWDDIKALVQVVWDKIKGLGETIANSALGRFVGRLFGGGKKLSGSGEKSGSSTEEEVRKLTRTELLELLIDEMKETDRLRAENEHLSEELRVVLYGH